MLPATLSASHDNARCVYIQVCVTLYWLGQRVSEMEGYSGPQLDLEAFGSIMDNSPVSNTLLILLCVPRSPLLKSFPST